MIGNILYVDDALLNHRMVELILGREGYTVLAAYNGLQALDILETTPVDLLITDIHMPFMDGLELLAKLRGGAYGNFPVVVITASGQEQISDLVQSKGAAGVLTQPYASVELKTMVKDLVATFRGKQGINRL